MFFIFAWINVRSLWHSHTSCMDSTSFPSFSRAQKCLLIFFSLVVIVVGCRCNSIEANTKFPVVHSFNLVDGCVWMIGNRCEKTKNLQCPHYRANRFIYKNDFSVIWFAIAWIVNIIMVDSSVLPVPDYSVSGTKDKYCNSPLLYLPSNIIWTKVFQSSDTWYTRYFHCMHPAYPVSSKRINHYEFFIEISIGFDP